MSYHTSKQNPTVSWIVRELEEISNRTEANLSVDNDTKTSESKYTFQSPSGNGSLIVYKGEQPSIKLRHENEPVDTNVDVDSISHLDFDIRPEDDQFRVGMSGEKNLDFGL